jgi:sRNA-binding carbon storage regulator CsrA
MAEKGSLLKRLYLNQSVLIGDIQVGFLDQRGNNQVLLLIKAPKDIPIVQGPNLEDRHDRRRP